MPRPPTNPGGIIPEWWAGSSRNPGRDQIGMVGAIKSEQWARSPRNLQAMLGAFEIHEEEREADEDLVAKVNGCVMVHATRQIYGASRKFSYILAARSRVR
jgi:hypothetical protein